MAYKLNGFNRRLGNTVTLGEFFLVIMLPLLILSMQHPHGNVSLNCTLMHGQLHPPTLMNCNGKNRSAGKVWDPRAVFNMSAREAFDIIESIHEAKGDCNKLVTEGKKPIPLLNIRFESTSFRDIANVAIRTANMMSDLLNRGACAGDLKNPVFRGNSTANMSEDFLFSIVKSNMQNHQRMFGSGIWFLENKYKSQKYFAPYAYRRKEDGYLRIKDLSTTWGPAHTNFLPFLESIANNRTYLCRSSYFTPRKNQTADEKIRHVVHPIAEYDDGLWGRPHFECSTTRAWIVGFYVPFFATRYDKPSDDPIEMMGVASVDIDLSQVDINQCDLDGTSQFTYKIFAGTHHCHNATSRCVHLPGKGFTVGSYKCVCRDGYYHPYKNFKQRYFNGSLIEENFAKGRIKIDPNVFACLPCREGCPKCSDDSPCTVEYDDEIRYSVLGINLFCILMLLGISGFIWRNKEVQVVKSASPLFLLITLLGATLMYCEALVLFIAPSAEVCTAAPWLQHVGFILMYGSLLLKTWRVSLIFKIKNAKRVTVSDLGLLQRLAPLVAAYIVLLVIWTVADNPTEIEYKTKDGLKFQTCTENWWHHSLLLLDILMLFWGIHLCYTIRKAPTKFNESKFISWSIYNMTVFMIFMKLMKENLAIERGRKGAGCTDAG
ncbi:probable G-protein coupled receptor CG31760 isoform X3 [Rhopilema esculentum]|uniref:probable G-protein coupled receptor CG31760 isoform X3 n=1 Tax=Rhopilema esculentum TaxID=499914 RepID=UPI0031DDA079|eukprot:gene8459-14447_t